MLIVKDGYALNFSVSLRENFSEFNGEFKQVRLGGVRSVSRLNGFSVVHKVTTGNI